MNEMAHPSRYTAEQRAQISARQKAYAATEEGRSVLGRNLRRAQDVRREILATPDGLAAAQEQMARARKARRERRGHTNWTPERIETLRQLAAAGWHAERIAERMDCTKHAVKRVAQRYGISLPRAPMSDAQRQKIGAESRRKWADPKLREQMSSAMRAAWTDPAVRERHAAARVGAHPE